MAYKLEFLGNIRGKQGPAGERGLPGLLAVENDEAFAAYLGSPTTKTFAAGASFFAQKAELSPIINGVAAGFTTAPCIAYGHSFIQGTGLTAPQYWAALVAAALGVGYTNRGLGSTTAEHSAFRMWGTTGNGFTIGSDATIIIQNMINSLGLNGEDPATWNGVNYSLRTMVAIASAKAVFSAENTRFTYGATGWGSHSQSTDYPVGKFRPTAASSASTGAYVEFTTTTSANGTYFLTLARRAGLSPALTEIKRMDTGAVLQLWDNQNNAAANLPAQIGGYNYAPAALPINAPAGTVIRVTNLSPGAGIGTTTVCGLLELELDDPNTVILMKEPKLADYSTSTMFPNRPDAAINYFNTIMDAIGAEFPNVIVASPEPFWTKGLAASLVQADHVHPNGKGNEALKQGAVLQVVARAMAKIAAFVRTL